MNTVLVGDCRQVLKAIKTASVQCVVTSPPYWGLRDYGVASQIGLEQSPAEYVEGLQALFAEVWRVLRPDGTVWLNLGDSYNAHLNQRKTTDAAGPKQATNIGSVGAPSRYFSGLKPKDLCGIPWRVAFALQAFGWYLRRDIIWHKPNPMPESVRDRPTTAHEYIFLLTKSETYYYDWKAIREPVQSGPSDLKKMIEGKERIGGKNKGLEDPRAKASKNTNIGQKRSVGRPEGRNKRSVWTVATAPFRGAHYATFPPALIRPCILAGARYRDVVLDPFSGSGTVGQVCAELGRSYIGIELNPTNAEMRAEERSVLALPL